ncbi:PKD domain-containing protein [Hyalangium rubrum]|uniref:PKD domain-containing protein n=1 Tax=Hyalangium rubrum TaxID=3103134 RepID=A0ABU5H0H1_9BACT|nr:PKD domain-containing protein [Hyalangium sp. s54d21]MDY7226424.1 PKD domain-containing protein [Hyalangium sp. s54d21]
MSRASASRLAWLAGLWAVAWVGCTTEGPPVRPAPVGSARVVYVLPRNLPADTLVRVSSTATSAGVSYRTELQGSGPVRQGWLRELPVGRYDIRAGAFDALGTSRFETQEVSVELAPQGTALIVLGVKDTSAQAEEESAWLQAVIASAGAVLPGDTVSLRAVASDPTSQDALSYEWQAQAGTFDDASAEAPVWKAPTEEGSWTVSLVVRDSRGTATSLSFPVEVSGVRALSGNGSVMLNRWPQLGELSAQPQDEVVVGAPVTVAASGKDADGDALTYQWTAECEGSLVDGSSATALFTPSAVPSEATCNNCQLRVRIQDQHGGSTSYGLGLCVRERRPPTVLATSATEVNAIPGEVLRFSVSAVDPAGGPLTFTWSASTGLVDAPVLAGGTSEVAWTSLSCIPAGGMPTLRATVTNLAGLSVDVPFTVNWNGPTCGHAPCVAELARDLVTFRDNCTTDTPVFIPDGFTLQGEGHTLSAVDPAGGSFVGAILRNRGTTAHVRGLKLEARGLVKSGACDVGEDRLRGILLLGASGSVVDSEVSGIHRNQAVDGNPEGTPRGCQEGHAIEVRNPAAAERRAVEVLRNRVSGHQKVGIVIIGDVDATVVDNEVRGEGPVSHIARNGVQLSNGATGRVAGNDISGHSYTGNDLGTGILVAGGAYYGLELCRDITIEGNTLTDNDIGIYLSQAEADGSGPATSTRLRVVDNVLSKGTVTNGFPFQAAISDLGGGNLISSNVITGTGYDPETQPGATFDVDVVAGDAAQVMFLTPTRTVAAGACSGRVLVQSQDVKGNLVKPTLATFTLTASGEAAAGLDFYATPDCSGPVLSTVELSTPQAETAFYFKAPSQPGAVTLTVSNGSLTSSQEQTVRAP